MLEVLEAESLVEIVADPVRYLSLAVILKALSDHDWDFIFVPSDDRKFWLRGACMQARDIEKAGRYHQSQGIRDRRRRIPIVSGISISVLA